MLRRGQIVIVRNGDSKFIGMKGRVISVFKDQYWNTLVKFDNYDHSNSHGLFFAEQELVRVD